MPSISPDTTASHNAVSTGTPGAITVHASSNSATNSRNVVALPAISSYTPITSSHVAQSSGGGGGESPSAARRRDATASGEGAAPVPVITRESNSGKENNIKKNAESRNSQVRGALFKLTSSFYLTT
jgi:hypothetical protein